MSARQWRLRRAKAILPDTSKLPNNPDLGSTSSTTPKLVNRLIRILIENPWDDYEYIQDLGQVVLARQKTSYFKLVNVRQFHSANLFQESRILSSIQHPNVASIYDVYCCNNTAFLITEHLHVGISQLEPQKYELKDWEIATMIAEVIRGVVHISSLEISCKELSKENIRLSLDGEVKLVLDPQNIKYDHPHESAKLSQVLLDFPILAEIIEDMMLSRYHLGHNEEGCSEAALNFLSCTLTGSLEVLTNHHFLSLAVSPRRLIPRIRFALETSSILATEG